jgi:hypothetical protein
VVNDGLGDDRRAEKMALLVKVSVGGGPFFHLAATKIVFIRQWCTQTGRSRCCKNASVDDGHFLISLLLASTAAEASSASQTMVSSHTISYTNLRSVVQSPPSFVLAAELASAVKNLASLNATWY